jgi:hypothetical protein
MIPSGALRRELADGKNESGRLADSRVARSLF